MVGASGAGGGWRREGDSRGFMFGPHLWIMQPSVRSAHCPPLDFLVSSVTITRLRFTPALTPSLPHRSPPPPLPPAPTLHSSEKHRWGKNNTPELSFLLLDKSRRVFSSTAGSPQNFITVVTITVTTKIIFIIIFYYLPLQPPPPQTLINFSLGLEAVIRSRRRVLPHQSPNLVQVKVNSAIYSREKTSPSWCLIMLSDGRREDMEAPEIYAMLMFPLLWALL